MNMPKLTSKDCLPFKTIGQGMTCGWADHGTVLVRDQKGLEWMWEQFYSHSLHPPELPDLDFSKVMWVCVFRGEFRTWGYPTEIKRIYQAKDPHSTFMRVQVLETNPPRRSYLKQEFSQPFHIVEMERTNRPFRFTFTERRWWL